MRRASVNFLSNNNTATYVALQSVPKIYVLQILQNYEMRETTKRESWSTFLSLANYFHQWILQLYQEVGFIDGRYPKWYYFILQVEVSEHHQILYGISTHIPEVFYLLRSQEIIRVLKSYSPKSRQVIGRCQKTPWHFVIEIVIEMHAVCRK